MAEGSGEPDRDRRFWQQIGQLTESRIEPPKDGWRKISARIDAERRQAEPPPAPPTAGGRGIRLPGVLVWLLSGFAVLTVYLLARQAQPAPLPLVHPGDGPTQPEPVDSGTRKMRIEWLRPPLQISRKAQRVKLAFRMTCIGSGRIVLPGPGTGSRHYFLTVRHAGRQWQYPLMATSADRMLPAGGSRAVGDLTQDQVLEPWEGMVVEVSMDAASLLPDGELGAYELQIRYAPPASSEKSSPPETDSPTVQVTVVK